jgi:UDPglucose--hexose-1-phosphate uridylyltransferase
MTAYRDSHSEPLPDTPVGADGRPHMLLSYASEELRRRDRVVEMDEAGWVAVVPYWAVWPFEVLGALSCLTTANRTVLPTKRQIYSLSQLDAEEAAGLARIMQKVLIRYDNLFE